MLDSVVLKKLQQVRPQVGPAKQKILDFVLSEPERVVHMSITELAELAGVSEATAVRLFQEIDFKGFLDFKIALSHSLGARTGQIDRALDSDSSLRDVLNAVFQTSVRTLQDTLQTVDEAALDQAVTLLANAKRIEFLGVGGAGVVAYDGYHKFLRLGIPVNACLDPHNAMQICSILGPGDVAVVVSHSGATKDTIEPAQIARERGADVIVITRYGRSPLHRYATVALHTLSPETEYRSESIASRIAQLALIDTLMVSVYLRLLPGSADSLQKSRSALKSKRF